jgi:hypothetical protein
MLFRKIIAAYWEKERKCAQQIVCKILFYLKQETVIQAVLNYIAWRQGIRISVIYRRTFCDKLGM